MFKYIVICCFLAHAIWAKPLRSHSEVAPHVLILTPQAQLRLESLVPGAPFIQHLTPFTSYFAPHEETIVYVPASAAAAVQNAEIFARSLQANKAKQLGPENLQSAVTSALATGLQAAQQAGQQASSFITNPSTFSPSDGISSVLSSISSFIPQQSSESSLSSQAQSLAATQAQNQLLSQQLQQQQQLQLQQQKQTQQLQQQLQEQQQQIQQQQQKEKPSLAQDLTIPPIISASSLATNIPAIPSIISPIIPSISLYANEPRHHYVVAPVAPHVVDIVPSSVLLSPTAATTIKARRSVSSDNKEAKPLTAIILPTAAKSEALPLKNDLEKAELSNKEKQDEDFKRFLEADALKEDLPSDNSAELLDKGRKKNSAQKSEENLAKKPAEINPIESSPTTEAVIEDEAENESPQTKEINNEN